MTKSDLISPCHLFNAFYNPPKQVRIQFCSRNTRSRPLTIPLPQDAVTTTLANRVWVFKDRTFTAPPNSPTVHCELGTDSSNWAIAQEISNSLPKLLTKIAALLPQRFLFD
ncbi:hypothetical protein V8E53_007960 [Lactarius tabidus]